MTPTYIITSRHNLEEYLAKLQDAADLIEDIETIERHINHKT